MTGPEPFPEVFFRKLDKACLALGSYLEDPSEQNVHDVRTSIRRLESAYSVLPKSCKTKKSDRLISVYGDFFSLNSAVRDHDIILKKLDLYGYGPESRASLLTSRRKLKKLLKAVALAEKVSKSKKPKLKKPRSAGSKFQKRVLSLIRDFREYVPVVAGDEDRIDELHSLRKTTKKLRYVLELPTGNAYGRLAASLKSLQGLLGDIHDCDVFIRYLKKNKGEFSDPSGILASEKGRRSATYGKLVLALGGFGPES